MSGGQLLPKLARDLRAGVWHPGCLLPQPKELAQRLGASEGTCVLPILAALAEAGLLTRVGTDRFRRYRVSTAAEFRASQMQAAS
jgi:DNA-binding FadR family transcriptional regulator